MHLETQVNECQLILEFLKTRIKVAVSKIIEPNWCMDAINICAPKIIVKIPKIICNNKNKKTKMVDFLK